jgi:hypothetical protein
MQAWTEGRRLLRQIEPNDSDRGMMQDGFLRFSSRFVFDFALSGGLKPFEDREADHMPE